MSVFLIYIILAMRSSPIKLQFVNQTPKKAIIYSHSLEPEKTSVFGHGLGPETGDRDRDRN